MKYIIDRFEYDMAILEGDDGIMFDVPRSLVAKDAKEGDCLILAGDDTYIIDESATASRKENIDNLIDDLFV